jgi:membrane-associated phospholipid phosphatase
MLWVVVATGNHWLLDAVLGAATAATSFYAAQWLARARPQAWAFSPAKATA